MGSAAVHGTYVVFTSIGGNRVRRIHLSFARLFVFVFIELDAQRFEKF